MTKINDTSQNAMERRKARREKRGNGNEPADWETLDNRMVLALIGRVTSFGGTITFGYTRDGGAYYLSYYMDGESEKVYIRPTEDVDQRILFEFESWE